MKKFVLAAVFIGAALFLQAAQQENAPKISGNTITIGSKKLELNKNGIIKVTAKGTLIAEILAYYSVDNLKTKQTDWSSFEAGISTLKQDGNKFVWVLNKKYNGKIWKAADQTLTILPDNRLKLETRMKNPADPDLKMRGDRGSQWIVLPLATADGAKCSFSGKSYTISSNGKTYAFGDSARIKNLDSVYYLGDAVREFKVEVPLKSCCWCSGTVYKSLKNIRYSFAMKDCLNGTLILNFNK